jgi:hypothetical protein
MILVFVISVTCFTKVTSMNVSQCDKMTQKAEKCEENAKNAKKCKSGNEIDGQHFDTM